MKLFFKYILVFVSTSLFAQSIFGVEIVSRSEWWADPELSYLDSAQWKSIIANSSTYTPSQKEQTRYSYLLDTYPQYFSFSSVYKSWSGRPLAVNIQKIETVRRIIVHHTADAFGDDTRSEAEIMRSIYKHHAITNRWWDIGYNFVIWPSGTIYEGRLWGANTRAFHTKWNNEHSIGIALMWNFELEKPTQKQILSLVVLISELKYAYDIPMNNDIMTFRDCLSNCSSSLLDINTNSWLIGHHEAGHTDCPGEYLDNWIRALRAYFARWR